MPSYASLTDEDHLLGFIRERSFGLFAAAHGGDVLLAEAPVTVGEGVLQFHLAKGNPFLEAARAGACAKAVFSGPDGYVSPDWYESGNQVPTWNYVSVYAAGPMRALSDAELAVQVDALSAEHERRLAPKKPWTRAKMTGDTDLRLLGAIAGIEMRLGTLEGKFKLSQNKPDKDRAGAIAALKASARPEDHALASMMQKPTYQR